jgi:hypothetical protein
MTSQTSRDAFATIANEAAYLAVAYPRLAESRRKSGHSLEWARQYAPADVKTELDRLLKEADACERCRKELVELSRMVRLRFSPETYAKLRLLPCPGPWHDQLGFDWQAAVAELRFVEATAVQAVNAEASGDGTGATATPAPADDTEPIDSIEDALANQPLALYRFLRDRKRWTSFANLETLSCWRDVPGYETIDRGLRRLRAELNQIDGAPPLLIDMKNSRTKLDRE